LLRGSPTPASRKLAEFILSNAEGIKQCAPFFPVSSALLGHTTRPGEPAETMS
jgi:hypothetical protein